MMEVMIVIRCGEAPVPPPLAEHPRVDCAEVPTRDEVDRARRELGPDLRLLVCGTDAALAAVLTRLMRTEHLDVEIAYVADEPTPATKAYGLPTGSEAAKLGVRGSAREVPLVRDDTGTALVGEATVKTHVSNIFAKLHLRDRVQAVVFAYESGLVRPGQA